MKVLIKNLKKIYTSEGDQYLSGIKQNSLKIYNDCDIMISNGIIADISSGIKETSDMQIIDAGSGIALPGFVDSHTHPIFSGTREHEFIKRIKGIDYKKITAEGGGIGFSIRNTVSADDEELFNITKKNISEFIRNGITAFEAKTGYAQNSEGELRLLRVLNKVKQDTELDMRITYLGGHIVPKDMDRKKFIEDVKKTIDIVAQEKTADYFDVWVEDIAFDLEEASDMIEHAVSKGLNVRIHANELSSYGGGLLCEKYPIISIDHFDFYTERELKILSDRSVNVTLLPLTQFSLTTENYPDGAEIIKNDIPVSLSTDFNPGTSYSSNMQFLCQIALLKCKMQINEIINAVTINPAVSLGLAESLGTLEPSKQADIVIMKVPNVETMFYNIAGSSIRYVIKNGTILYTGAL